MNTEPITCPAIIYVDGEAWIHCTPADDYNLLFKDTVESVGGEVALMVWKPRHQIYLREKLVLTARK